MKRESLEYLFLPPRTVELKLNDEFIGVYFETVKIERVSYGEQTVLLNGFPYLFTEIMNAHFVGEDEERIAEIENAPSLETAILFTDDNLSTLCEIALNKKKEALRFQREMEIIKEVNNAINGTKLTIASVLRFIATNYGVDTENDLDGVKRHYKQAIEKLKARPF